MRFCIFQRSPCYVRWQPIIRLGWTPHIKRTSRVVDVRARSASTAESSSTTFNRQYREERLAKLSELLEDVVRTAVDTGPRGAIRFAQGIEALVNVGGEWALDQLKNASTSRTTSSGVQFNVPGPLQLRKLFERLGATYIKLGQFIASAPTLFPEEYVKEFQNCLDKTPPVPFDQIKDIIREDLGRPLEEVYDYVDPVPLASASVAQVHAARLKGSMKDVVVKVLKPGVGDTLIADLNFLYVAARILEFLNPQISRTSLVGIVGDIRASMLEEVDFRKEAINIESFRKYIDSAGLSSQATAPLVYRHCSTRRVLTMERFYGVPLTDLDSIKSLVVNPEVTLITALNVWFGSLLACESFHADVHAGNLLVLKDGRVGFIDFGIVGRISPSTWQAIETFLTSVGNGQYNAMAAALVQMGATDAKVDVPKFARDLEKIFTAVQDLDSEILITASGGPRSATVAATLAVDEQQVNALFLDVVRVSEAYGLRFPREFGLLLKQLLYFDRYTRLLAPNLNVLDDERVMLASARSRDVYNRYR
ncbi:hypothetical protein KP509_35G036400 [Ceratopteris richardii]|uniref:Protein kinase domain-containing protein n=1 Tax=Ceratopteris richardii TaxID=49495 RepID=A0A8T2QG48_CERRI|nr:hypothetical protein KP509_35G036400 [Ceratopteris richardii]